MNFQELLNDKKTLATVIIGLLVVGIILFKVFTKKEEFSPEKVPLYTSGDEVGSITLYFGSDNEDKEFEIESREIHRSQMVENQIKQAILKLIEGPKTDTANSIIPKGTAISEVFIEGERVYLDFNKELSINHPGGTIAEKATVSCIVNTIVKNFPKITEVQFLIEGRIKETLAGHIDIRQPFKEKAESEEN